MEKLIKSSSLGLVLALLILGGSGCSPHAKMERYLAKADQYLAKGDYDRAEIEFKNALQIDSQNTTALGKLGTLYFNQGRILSARSLLLIAAEHAPANLELKLQLGLSDLAVRDFEGARTKAEFVLDRTPGNPEAPALLAEAATDAQTARAAIERLKKLPPANAETAAVHAAIGLLELRLNQPDLAEADLQKALALDSKCADAHSTMSDLYLIKKNLPLAGSELKLAADLSPARSPRRIKYAQFLLLNGEVEASRKLLVGMTQSTPDYLPAWMSLTQLVTQDKKYDEALVIVGKVLARDPINPDALVLKARLYLAKGDFAQAEDTMARALEIYPSSPQFKYQLALARAAQGDTRRAIESLNQVLAQTPAYTDAALLLAGLQLRVGERSTAISSLKVLLKQHPGILQGWLLLADAYRGMDNPAAAVAVYDEVDKSFPKDPQTALLKGLAQMQAKKIEDARASFNQALERSPDLVAATEQLIYIDLGERKFAAAKERVDGLINRQPKLAEAYVLRAKVHAAQKNLTLAEADLQKAIELQPDDPTPFFMLATIHLADKEPARALETFGQIIAKNPKDTQALLMSGLLNEQLHHYDKALAAYEQLLAIRPNSGIALNNAAVLYSEKFNQLDKAFAAAQRARELFPHEPNLADTLGWILVKKRQYPRALGLLQESADKMPASADIQYHLGVVQYLLGNEESARQSLEAALRISPLFPGSDDARSRLAVLGVVPGRPGAAGEKILANALKARSDDPVVLARLAAGEESAGNTEKALATYEDALKASPTNLSVMSSLIRLYAQKNDPAKAIELAKTAHQQAPDNTGITFTLGRLAYQTRDYNWAVGLLQEASRRQPDDAAGLRDLARADYSVGRVDEAVATMTRSLQLDGLSAAAAEGRRFLDLVALAGHPAQAVAAMETIGQALKAAPNNVPALMAAAAAGEMKADASAATAAYEKVLAQFPDFTPAKRRLAILLAAGGGDNKRAFDLAVKARAVFPEDPELAKAYGIILYRMKEYPRAFVALRESQAARANDPEIPYYLGLTQFKLGDRAAARQSLQRALDLKLGGNPADDARKLLETLK